MKAVSEAGMTLQPALLSRMTIRRMMSRRMMSRRMTNCALVAALSLVLAVPPGFAQANSQTPPAAKDAAPNSATQNSAAQNNAAQNNAAQNNAAQNNAAQTNNAAQSKDSVATIAVDVNVVALPVTVRDKHGAIVKDLTKDDFSLLENGRPQPIKYFSLDSNLPLTMGLLVDTSFSQREVLDQERNASHSFLDQMLTQEKDKAFLLHFDHQVELLQDLTHKRDRMQSALDLLKTGDDDTSHSNDPNTDDSHSGSRHGGNELYDAVYLASNELMKKQSGRKAVIILSDGVDRGSHTSLESAIEAAQRSDTIVYTIYFKGIEERHDRHDNTNSGRGGGYPGGGYPGGGGGWPGGGGGYPGGGGQRGGRQPRSEEKHVDGKKILERISKETGGRFFEISKKELVGDAYTSISEELRTQYSLGFTPDKDAAGEGYHHIVLQVKKKDMAVQTREGYYGTLEN
jgi:VWFA-related protein